jgi:hypothetical protein
MGCEKNHEVRTQTAEIKCLHGLPAYETCTDHQCNEENGEKLNVFSLNIENSEL